ncbi:hypothetical protein SAMN05421766_103593 [Zobellia uliginosa]|uniref:Uncharacterized protein n=1 Tax=Zobellia uliginosa TaxID=143224 RepID=A0ABY1KSJ2_9FLAO|nr:hypothetical protein [Zobellia uliginosa]SIS71830.1 hypothetical protein SAMN05421766_103593 [Zobellia uliginosa]
MNKINKAGTLLSNYMVRGEIGGNGVVSSINKSAGPNHQYKCILEGYVVVIQLYNR